MEHLAVFIGFILRHKQQTNMLMQLLGRNMMAIGLLIRLARHEMETSSFTVLKGDRILTKALTEAPCVWPVQFRHAAHPIKSCWLPYTSNRSESTFHIHRSCHVGSRHILAQG